MRPQGVFLDIANSTLTCNNLGGLGPDTDCPEQEIRYSGVGIDYGDGSQPPIKLDLVRQRRPQTYRIPACGSMPIASCGCLRGLRLEAV